MRRPVTVRVRGCGAVVRQQRAGGSARRRGRGAAVPGGGSVGTVGWDAARTGGAESYAGKHSPAM
jgi:hypothetical protein